MSEWAKDGSIKPQLLTGTAKGKDQCSSNWPPHQNFVALAPDPVLGTQQILSKYSAEWKPQCLPKQPENIDTWVSRG